MRYYKCTNCGNYEDFGKERFRNLSCGECGYSDILELDDEDWKETIRERPWLADKNIFQESTEK